jgi:hypothetical protein
MPARPQIQRLDGFEVHCHVADIGAVESEPWEIGKRWAFSESRVFFDPDGRISKLLREKVPLRPEERRWLLISGITLSEWYINRLTALRVRRGSIASAHSMFGPGLGCFFNVLFGLNNRLVADRTWRYYCAERLEVLPPGFGARMGDVMALHALDEDDLARRRDAFMGMWRDTLPLVEQGVGMRWDAFKDTV